MDNNDRLRHAMRLIKLVTGEEYGDYETVTGVGVGYASGQYGDTDQVWVTGNWNDKRRKITNWKGENVSRLNWWTVDNTPGRLLAALERIGVECEWLDEWTECGQCYRLIPSSPDSYGFMLDAIMGEDGITCGECARENPDWYIDEYVDNSDRAITYCDADVLSAMGFSQWSPDDPQEYQNGWHAGQDDNPATVMDEIHSANSDYQVVFLLTEQSQFYLGFAAYYRLTPE